MNGIRIRWSCSPLKSLLMQIQIGENQLQFKKIKKILNIRKSLIMTSVKISIFSVSVGVAELVVLCDLHQPPADHPQLLRQLLHLFPEAQAPGGGHWQHHRPAHHVDLYRCQQYGEPTNSNISCLWGRRNCPLLLSLEVESLEYMVMWSNNDRIILGRHVDVY